MGFAEYCHTQNKINMGICLTTWIWEWETKINERERDWKGKIYIESSASKSWWIYVLNASDRVIATIFVCFFFILSGCPGLISRYFGAVSISLYFFLSFRNFVNCFCIIFIIFVVSLPFSAKKCHRLSWYRINPLYFCCFRRSLSRNRCVPENNRDDIKLLLKSCA